MDMQVSTVGGVKKIALSGRLDTAGVSRLETQFSASVAAGGQSAVVDLTDVAFLASLGVRMFISTARTVTRKGGKLALYGANAAVMEIIETTSLNDIIPVAPSEAEALALVAV